MLRLLTGCDVRDIAPRPGYTPNACVVSLPSLGLGRVDLDGTGNADKMADDGPERGDVLKGALETGQAPLHQERVI